MGKQLNQRKARKKMRSGEKKTAKSERSLQKVPSSAVYRKEGGWLKDKGFLGDPIILGRVAIKSRIVIHSEILASEIHFRNSGWIVLVIAQKFCYTNPTFQIIPAFAGKYPIY